MYQDLNAVYREDCNVPTVTQQSSFNWEESLQNQVSENFYSYLTCLLVTCRRETLTSVKSNDVVLKM